MVRDNDNEPGAPLSEPVIIPEVVCTEISVDGIDGMIRFVGAARLPALGSDEPERRVQVRFTMPAEAARCLWRDLGAELKKRSH